MPLSAEDGKKRIVDLTEDELVSLGLLGGDVAPGIQLMVRQVMANPERLRSITCSMIDVLIRLYPAPAAGPPDTPAPASPTPPTSPTLSDETVFTQLSSDSDALAAVGSDLVSKYESNFYYHGVGGPKLMWRSDLETNPFPVPARGTRFHEIPTKTAHGVFNTKLNTVWHDVAPRIIASMKANGIRFSALTTARFSTTVEGEKPTFGHVVVWIAVHPNTAKPWEVRGATPAILQILYDFDVTDVVVEWYEGKVVRLAGPPLMPIVNNTSPRFGITTPFNTGLGIPIARQSDDAQGTVTLLFREVKTSTGEPSDRILALTNKHVASVDLSTDYDATVANSEANDPEHIIVCSTPRFNIAFAEIETAMAAGIRDALRLAKELEDLNVALNTPDGDPQAVRRKAAALEEQNEDNVTLGALVAELETHWKDPNNRRFGVVEWAPKVSVRVDERHYTRDLATLAVDAPKVINFKMNSVDLGRRYTVNELEDNFWPYASIREARHIPANRQLPIRRVVPRHRVLNPDTVDGNGEPLYIVGKYGSRTKLTLGRYSGMEGYTCSDIGEESIEVVVYNYDKHSEDFCAGGDSGALIFTGDGEALAMLHSGMPRGMHNHVAFATPMWWVVETVRAKYPFAEFCGTTC